MKHKILVIDDEPDVVAMIHGHFQRRGFEVVSALDGEEGIRVCAAEKPHVILIDLKMKKMDGDQAIGALRCIVPAAKIFVISAYQDAMTQKRVASLKVDGYYAKPISILKLQTLIETACQNG